MLSHVEHIAREAGQLLRDHFGEVQKINQAEAHDIKLQMDVDCQRLIEKRLMAAYPSHSIVGEEECCGDPNSEYRWIVDPLDGTVNYTYGIPHFCVSIALQKKQPEGRLASDMQGYESILGVVYDPMKNELFSSEKGGGTRLNGKPIRASDRACLEEAIMSVGFSKSDSAMEKGLGVYTSLTRRARKIRTMGSAALDLAYVAAGRMEVYLEFKVRLWDIAAGVLMVQEGGGAVKLRPYKEDAHTFEALASNGKADWWKLTGF